MPTNRKQRTRRRILPGLSPAQKQWLTGHPQDGANKFELMDLEAPTSQAQRRRCLDLLEQFSQYESRHPGLAHALKARLSKTQIKEVPNE